MTLKLSPQQLKLVKSVLAQHVPKLTVWAFGSRVHGHGLKPASDLDLALITKQPLSLSQLGALKEAFAESDLPFRVDVVDWSTLEPSFQLIVKKDHIVI